jgi:UDP-glucose 4-epimerase
MNNARVLVTGGAGFIGRATIVRLLKAGIDVVCFDLAEQIARNLHELNEMRSIGTLTLVQGSLLDRNMLREAVSGCNAVIHLAAMLGVKKTEANKLSCIEVNINGTDNLLAASVTAGVTKFIFASSSEVYGEPISNPVTEDDITQGKTVYAITKLAGEELVKGYNQMYPTMHYTIARFFNTYGEGQVAQFVLSKFVREVKSGRSPIVYGTGAQVRSYGHVSDVVEGIYAILNNPISNNRIYNLGNSSQVMTLVELAQLVINLVAPKSGLKVEVLGNFSGADRESSREIQSRYCDTSRAKTELGYDPKINVSEGIRRIAKQDLIHETWPELNVRK